MKIHPLTILLLVVPSQAFGPPKVARADESSKQFFMENYPEAFRVLEGKFANIDGSCRIIHELGKRPKRYFNAEFAIRGASEKVVLHETSKDAAGKSLLDRVFCINDGSFFSLIREPEETSYSITGIGSDDNDRIAYSNHFRKFIKAPFGIFGSRLIDALNSPHFRLTGADWVGKPRESPFKIQYQAGQAPAINDVELTFDPQTSWVLRSGRIATSDMPGAALTFAIDYDPASSQPCFPTMVKFKNVNSQVETCTFGRIEAKDIPAGEFKPQFFGLPDLTPRSPSGRGSSYTLAFLGLGLLALCVKFALGKVGPRVPGRTQPT